MIGALVRQIVRRQMPLLIVAAVAALLFFWTFTIWPLATWAPVWALVFVGFWVVAALHDTGDES